MMSLARVKISRFAGAVLRALTKAQLLFVALDNFNDASLPLRVVKGETDSARPGILPPTLYLEVSVGRADWLIYERPVREKFDALPSPPRGRKRVVQGPVNLHVAGIFLEGMKPLA